MNTHPATGKKINRSSTLRADNPTSLFNSPSGGVYNGENFTLPNNMTNVWKAAGKLFDNVKETSSGNTRYFQKGKNESEFEINKSGRYSILVAFGLGINPTNIGSSVLPVPKNLYNFRLDIQTPEKEYADTIGDTNFTYCSIPLSDMNTSKITAYVLEHNFNTGDIVKLRLNFSGVLYPDYSQANLYFQISNYGYSNFATVVLPAQPQITSTVALAILGSISKPENVELTKIDPPKVETVNRSIVVNPFANKVVPPNTQSVINTVVRTPNATMSTPNTVVRTPINNNQNVSRRSRRNVAPTPAPVVRNPAEPIMVVPKDTPPVVIEGGKTPIILAESSPITNFGNFFIKEEIKEKKFDAKKLLRFLHKKF